MMNNHYVNQTPFHLIYIKCRFCLFTSLILVIERGRKVFAQNIFPVKPWLKFPFNDRWPWRCLKRQLIKSCKLAEHNWTVWSDLILYQCAIFSWWKSIIYFRFTVAEQYLLKCMRYVRSTTGYLAQCFFHHQSKKKRKCTPHPLSHFNHSSSKVLLLNSPFCLNREPELLILYWQTVLLALLYYPAGPLEKLSEGLVYSRRCQLSPGERHKVFGNFSINSVNISIPILQWTLLDIEPV